MKLIYKLYGYLKKKKPTYKEKIYRLSINELNEEKDEIPDEVLKELQDATFRPYGEHTTNSVGSIEHNGKKYHIKKIKVGEPDLQVAREKAIHYFGKLGNVYGLGNIRTLHRVPGESHTIIMPHQEGYNLYDDSLLG